MALLCAGYKLITWLYYLRIRHLLANQPLDRFKKKLGHHCKYKPMLSGLKRYKWMNVWIIVKADFDDAGKLSNSNKISFRPMNIISEIVFE